jgi:tRNA pseudouridine55 synthase
VEIRELELLGIEGRDVLLRIACSSGTYVRSLARDLGATLGTAAALWELTRTRSGPFGLGDARPLAEVTAAGPEAWSWVLPAARMVQGLPACAISAEEAREIAQGRVLCHAADAEGGPVALFGPEGNLVAVARSQGECLQPLKVFAQTE